MRLIAFSAALLGLAAAPAMADTDKNLTHLKYACDGNATLDVVFVLPESGNNYAVVLEQDELVPMAQVQSASGEIYTAVNPDYDYQLLVKGNEATLMATTNGKEEAVKANCKVSD